MKHLLSNISILLVSCVAVGTAEWAQADDDSSSRSSREYEKKEKEDKKKAKDWVKQEIAKKKKALGILKKVKDQQTAEEACKKLQTLVTSGKGVKLDNDSTLYEEKIKKEKLIYRLNDQIEAERKRILQLEGVINSQLLEDISQITREVHYF